MGCDVLVLKGNKGFELMFVKVRSVEKVIKNFSLWLLVGVNVDIYSLGSGRGEYRVRLLFLGLIGIKIIK